MVADQSEEEFKNSVDKAMKTCGQKTLSKECMFECIMKESGMLDANDNFREEVIPERLRVKAVECFNETNQFSGCARASAVADCFPK